MSPPPDLAYQYSPEELTSMHELKHHASSSHHSESERRSNSSHHSGSSHHSSSSRHSGSSNSSQHSDHSYSSQTFYLEPDEEQPRGKYERPPEKEVKSESIRIVKEASDDVVDLHIDDLIRDACGEDVEDEGGLIHLIFSPRAVQEAQPGKKTKKRSKPPFKLAHPALHKLLSVVLVFTILIFSIGVAGVLWITYQLGRGRNQMVVNYDGVVIELPTDNENIVSDDHGQTVRYNGHVYALNPNISTVLFMGVDREDMEAVDEMGNGGQADVILLLAEDTETGKMKILNISRDTYAEYIVYSKGGYQLGYEKQQICLAYAYGDGREKSCENTLCAVQNLLYGMPISKYIAMDMDGVIAANEAIGGVSLNALEDITLTDGKEVKAGEAIELHDEDVNRYIRSREHDVDGNNRRIEREKQYVSSFASLAVRQAKADLGVVSTLYSTIMPYVVTNLEIGDLMFLAQIYMNYGVDFEFKSLTGEMNWLDNQYGKDVAVLYPDKDNLFETVLDLYYTQVE